MATSWSLILNVLLLGGVVFAIGRMLKAKREQVKPAPYPPSIMQNNTPHVDDIIAVRKVDQVLTSGSTRPVIPPVNEEKSTTVNFEESSPSLMMFLLAKDNRHLAGYELLQTVLAAGLRFGEGQIFHRHQFPHGQGPVLCSLAAATKTGQFDLQNIGAFNARGLCLFMQASGNEMIDQERFNIMYETAKQLCEGLDTHLLDDEQKPLSQASLERYRRQLKAYGMREHDCLVDN